MTLLKKTALMVIFLLSLSGAAGAREREIRIAMWKLPLNLPAMAAADGRVYERSFEGEYKIRYIDLPSGPKQVQAMAAGELDIAEGLGAAAALVGIANGADITIIGANSRSPEAFAIVVKNPKIRSVSELKGKKIGGLRGSVDHQLFVELMNKEGISEKDVEFYSMTLRTAASSLIAGRVDAALLAGTEILRAEKGGCRILSDGKGHIDGLSLIVAGRKFADENRTAVEKYLTEREKIRIKAVESLPDNMPMLKKETGLSEKEIIKMLSKYDYFTGITKKDVDELKKTAEYLKKENIIKHIPNINDILWKSSSL